MRLGGSFQREKRRKQLVPGNREVQLFSRTPAQNTALAPCPHFPSRTPTCCPIQPSLNTPAVGGSGRTSCRQRSSSGPEGGKRRSNIRVCCLTGIHAAPPRCTKVGSLLVRSVLRHGTVSPGSPALGRCFFPFPVTKGISDCYGDYQYRRLSSPRDAHTAGEPHQPPYNTGPTITIQQKGSRGPTGFSGPLRLPGLAGGKGWRAAGSRARAVLSLLPSLLPHPPGGPVPPSLQTSPFRRRNTLASQGLPQREPQQNRGSEYAHTACRRGHTAPSDSAKPA